MYERKYDKNKEQNYYRNLIKNVKKQNEKKINFSKIKCFVYLPPFDDSGEI